MAKEKKAMVAVPEKPVFPPRLFTKDEWPDPERSFQIYSSTPKLFEALKEALEPDEWDEIYFSKLGLFLQYHESKITWASRVGHFLLAFQVSCLKNEIWSLIGSTPIRFSLLEFEEITKLNCEFKENIMTTEVEVTEEMKEFWTLLGVDIAVGPSYDSLVDACKRCGYWHREDRVRLGYLSILASSILAQPHSQGIEVNLSRLVMDLEKFPDYPWGRVAFKKLLSSVKSVDITKTYSVHGFAQVLQSWAYFALPMFAKELGDPKHHVPDNFLLAYGGSKGRKNIKNALLKQTDIKSFVRKDYEEMFPLWEDEQEDPRVDNILKAMYGQLKGQKKVWIWAKDDWPAAGVLPSYPKVKEEPGKGIKREAEMVLGEDSVKKARLDASLESFEQRIIDAITVALDARVDQVEASMREQFVDFGLRLHYLSQKVDQIGSSIGHAKKVEPAGEGEQALKDPQKDGGSEAKSTAADVVSLPPPEPLNQKIQKYSKSKNSKEGSGDSKKDDKELEGGRGKDGKQVPDETKERKSGRLAGKRNQSDNK